jgi:hypothetical protein
MADPNAARGSDGLTGCIDTVILLNTFGGGCGAPPTHCTRPVTAGDRLRLTTSPLTPFSPTVTNSLAHCGGSTDPGAAALIVAPAGAGV